MTGGLAATMLGMRFGPTRALLDRVLPEPGEGPDEKTRARGRFRVEVRATTATGASYTVVVAALGRPRLRGDGGDARGERALALALGEDLPDRAGVLTPGDGAGDALVERPAGAPGSSCRWWVSPPGRWPQAR